MITSRILAFVAIFTSIPALLTVGSEQTRTEMANEERTFIMVKPDGVQRGLVGKISERFEQKGFKLVAMKFMWVSTLKLHIHFKGFRLVRSF